MVRLSVILVLLGALAAPAAAQSAADRARAVLVQVPLAVVEGRPGLLTIGVGNGDAVRWTAVRGAQAGLNPDTPHRFAAIRSASPLQAPVLEAFDADSVQAAIGLNHFDWIDTWEVAVGPVRVGAMDIHPDSAMRLRGAAFSRGFEMTTRAGTTVMWTGAEDHRPGAGPGNPANPFGGADGLPARYAIFDDRLVWSTGWDTLEAVLAPRGPGLDGHPAVAALLDGLRQVRNPGAAAAMRFWIGAEGLPLAGAAAAGVSGVLMADFADRSRENAALVLLLAPGADAPALAETVQVAWPVLGSATDGTAPEVAAAGTAAAPSLVITLRGEWGADGAARNNAYDVLADVLAQGRLGRLLAR